MFATKMQKNDSLFKLIGVAVVADMLRDVDPACGPAVSYRFADKMI